MTISLHRLELFYFVVRFGGIVNAAQKMPDAISRAALSREMNELERDLQGTLFHRWKFALTPFGAKIYEYVRPIKEQLPTLAEEWRGAEAQCIRLGAPTIVHREYLLPILKGLRQKFPKLDLDCQEGTQETILTWLREKLLDVAVSLQAASLPPDYRSEVVARLQLALLVRKTSPVRSATQLWGQQTITEPLVSLPRSSPVTQAFLKGLSRRNVQWRFGLHATSLELVESHVAEGPGIGLTLAMPGHKLPGKNLRTLPLTDFPHVPLSVVYRTHPNEASQAVVQELCRAGRRLSLQRGQIGQRQ